METNNKKTTRILAVLCIAVAVICIIGFFGKNFDYPEKPLKYKHIRRISD